MRKTWKMLVGAFLVAGLAVPSAASALGPPLPVAADGQPVEVHATGVPVPTQITFGAGNTFISGGEEGEDLPGGIFVVKPGETAATPILGSPKSSYGVVWSGKTLFASADKNLVAYSKWNGKKFLKKKILIRGARNFNGWNGLAIGPDNRIYTGAALSQQFDHKANRKMKYANTVISIRKNGKDLKVVSKGVRQPWQFTFAKGEKYPIVSNLAQDLPKGANAPDFLFKAKPGSNFGFPSCNWAIKSKCAKFTKPLKLISHRTPAASPMGVSADGRKLYLVLFGGLPGENPGIVTLNASGKGPMKPFLTGAIPVPMLSVTYHRGYVYAGDLTGTVYKVKP